jgi:hypothetical protein
VSERAGPSSAVQIVFDDGRVAGWADTVEHAIPLAAAVFTSVVMLREGYLGLSVMENGVPVCHLGKEGE